MGGDKGVRMSEKRESYKITEYRLAKEIITRGGDILFAESIEPMKTCIQHGTTSVFAHVLSVAKHSLMIAHFLETKFGVKIDYDSLVRGALLHDYFLYDWHDKTVPGVKIHGFTHPRAAMENAIRDFELNTKEQDIIRKHMFPLTLVPPRTRESAIVCIADKWCAIFETFKIDISDYILGRVNAESQMALVMKHSSARADEYMTSTANA